MDLRPNPLELRDVLRTDHAAVETQPVRPDPRRQRLQVEEFFVQAVDFEQEPTGFAVPVEWDKALLRVHAARVLGDGLGGERPPEGHGEHDG